jgi:hypothetical protein
MRRDGEPTVVQGTRSRRTFREDCFAGSSSSCNSHMARLEGNAAAATFKLDVWKKLQLQQPSSCRFGRNCSGWSLCGARLEEIAAAEAFIQLAWKKLQVQQPLSYRFGRNCRCRNLHTISFRVECGSRTAQSVYIGTSCIMVAAAA